jgi:hypothetical protein
VVLVCCERRQSTTYTLEITREERRGEAVPTDVLASSCIAVACLLVGGRDSRPPRESYPA